MLLAGDSLWILLVVVLLWRQRVVRATQTTSPPPPSSVDRPTPCSPCSPFPGPQCLGCGLWMSATSWLSAQGLAGDWPVVEVQYQALSVSSSFHFLPPLSAGWAVVSGTNILWLTLWRENERITLRIGIFIAMPMKRGLFKTLKCSGVVFLNRPRKLWQMVYCISQYFISGTFNCHFLASEEQPLTHSMYLHTVTATVFFFFCKEPFPFIRWINVHKMPLKTFYFLTHGSYIFCQDSHFLCICTKPLCVWITLSDTHTGTYMLTYTSVLHMVADRPTHVGGFVTIIRLIGPSLLGNITCTHKGLW